jgi:signal recognition particle receptor subunit beta
MPRIDAKERTLTLKLVYYGPAMGGKTTNLRSLHEIVDPARSSELRSLDTEGDRTLFFDLLPIDLGDVCGLRLNVRLFTVPGQVHYNATRRIVLQGADAVVFVADSLAERMEANREGLRNLRANLNVNGIAPGSIPIVVQANKRDVPGAVPLDEMRAQLGAEQLGEHASMLLPELVPAQAKDGVGVVESFRAALLAAVSSTCRQNGLDGLGVARGQIALRLHEVLAPIEAKARARAEKARRAAPSVAPSVDSHGSSRVGAGHGSPARRERQEIPRPRRDARRSGGAEPNAAAPRAGARDGQ